MTSPKTKSIVCGSKERRDDFLRYADGMVEPGEIFVFDGRVSTHEVYISYSGFDHEYFAKHRIATSGSCDNTLSVLI